MAKSKLALEILVLPPLRAAAVGPIDFVLPLPLPLLGGLTTVLVLDSNLHRALCVTAVVVRSSSSFCVGCARVFSFIR